MNLVQKAAIVLLWAAAAVSHAQSCKAGDTPDGTGRCFYAVQSSTSDWSCRSGDQRLVVASIPPVPVPRGFTEYPASMPVNVTVIFCSYTPAAAPVAPVVPPTPSGSATGGCKAGERSLGNGMCLYTPALVPQTVSAGCQVGEQILGDGSCVHNLTGSVCSAGQQAYGTNQCRYTPPNMVVQRPGPCKTGETAYPGGQCAYKATTP